MSALTEKKSNEGHAVHPVLKLRYDPQTKGIILERLVGHGKNYVDMQLDELEQEVIDDLPELLEDFLAENEVVINNFLGIDYREAGISEMSWKWIIYKFKEYLKERDLPVPADLDKYVHFDENNI